VSINLLKTCYSLRYGELVREIEILGMPLKEQVPDILRYSGIDTNPKSFK
jgi:hypothetical protein